MAKDSIGLTEAKVRPIEMYLKDLGYSIDPRDLVVSNSQRPSALCYLADSGRLLMLKRRKEPFSQHWTAPGGKLEDGETPQEAVVREVWEETGFTVEKPQLRVICSESSHPQDVDYNWLLFVFRADSYSGELIQSDEGELRWLPIDELHQWNLPEVDRRIMEFALNDELGPQYVKVEYTPDHQVKHLESVPLEAMSG